jgi:transcription elongation factor Elf1
MLYRIPMDRGAFKDRSFVIDSKFNAPFCKKHGAMNVVTVVEKNGKRYSWYRCLVCHIGVVYDKEKRTNQAWVEEK